MRMDVQGWSVGIWITEPSADVVYRQSPQIAIAICGLYNRIFAAKQQPGCYR